MPRRSQLDRMHRHLKGGVRVECYEHPRPEEPLPKPTVQCSDPILRGLLRAVRALRRSHNAGSKTLPSLRQ